MSSFSDPLKFNCLTARKSAVADHAFMGDGRGGDGENEEESREWQSLRRRWFSAYQLMYTHAQIHAHTCLHTYVHVCMHACGMEPVTCFKARTSQEAEQVGERERETKENDEANPIGDDANRFLQIVVFNPSSWHHLHHCFVLSVRDRVLCLTLVHDFSYKLHLGHERIHFCYSEKT